MHDLLCRRTLTTIPATIYLVVVACNPPSWTLNGGGFVAAATLSRLQTRSRARTDRTHRGRNMMTVMMVTHWLGGRYLGGGSAVTAASRAHLVVANTEVTSARAAAALGASSSRALWDDISAIILERRQVAGAESWNLFMSCLC